MRILFEIDRKDYDPNGSVCVRPSVRGVIQRDGRLAMIHSLKYDYYKFPGGGAEEGEDHIATLIREVREESGLCVIPESIRPYGYVHRVQKGWVEDIFVQDNYYYFCDAEEMLLSQELDEYEDEERFTLEFVTAQEAVAVNRTHDHGEKAGNARFQVMIERENRVLELLIAEQGGSCEIVEEAQK